MKLKKMLYLLGDTRVIIYCNNQSLMRDYPYALCNANYAFALSDRLLKCKVKAVKPDYINRLVTIYVDDKSDSR